ncbi:MAG: DUF4012 domain-containing protein [Actinomycetales bacterium]|nr:DUF4012 domain-containing protein [Actinomycetales bacterium]
MGWLRRYRPRTLVGLGLLIVVVLLLGSAAIATATAYRSGAAAQASVASLARAVSADDYPAAEAAVAQARSQIDVAGSAAANPAIRILGVLPWLGEPFRAMGTLTQAGDRLVRATEDLFEVYTLASGEGVGATKLVLNGQINVERLASYQPLLAAAHTSLQEAQERLAATPTGGPVGGRIAALTATAEAEVAPLSDLLGNLLAIYPRLPGLLGAEGPTRYLLVILNPAELRATGGAPLSAALIEFDDGAMSVLRQGATSTEFFLDNRKVTWQTLVGPPLGPAPGEPDRFVNANQHPDFRISGEQLARAWQAGGLPAVDGVIALDTTAIAGVLGAIGPVQTEGYGEVTQANLAETILFDAYTQVRDKSTRHDLNAQLSAAVVAALVTGENLPGVARALFAGTGGRHVQAWLVDPQAQQVLSAIGLTGEVDREAPDQIAVYTQNTNGSKVDVYQQREVRHEVLLDADGSASVTQLVTLNNATPGQAGEVPGEPRDGYYTRWSRPALYQYLPGLAQQVEVVAPAGWESQTILDDGQGRPLVRSRGWIAPGGIVTITLRYRLPPDTFTRDPSPAAGGVGAQAARRDGSGGLQYSAIADPQPMFTTPSLVLSVTFPSAPPPQPPPGWAVRGSTVELITAFTTRVPIAVPEGSATARATQRR